ncbi:heavy-metal-associated domain-containing protein [Pseudobutyrivibrio sp. LB2011]|uniref:heavy-metal-associated domain-containing protein n=1 Tax=Pseudobutyrivibrio sp. LB2011 TaxID=1408312 RepID=UPI0005D28249|nr:cation transporter [Pseudobutyrivibrio sp. LB2011]
MLKVTLKIEGMMCGMCEAHINDVIRKVVPDAKKVKSSYAKGVSTFISETEPDKDELTAAIAETGYTLQNIETEEYTKKIFGLF